MTEEKITAMIESFLYKVQRKISDYTHYCDEQIAKYQDKINTIQKELDSLDVLLDRILEQQQAIIDEQNSLIGGGNE